MDGAEIKLHFLLALMIVMTTDPTICFVSLDSLSPSQLYSIKNETLSNYRLQKIVDKRHLCQE